MSATVNGEGVLYCTREDVRGALGFQSTSQMSNARIDRQIEAASRSIEGELLRYFFPTLDTQTFDWPTHQLDTPWRIWLDQRELAAPATSVTVSNGGTDISANCFFRPDYGPPYTHIEVDLASQSAFNSGSTYQRSVTVTGLFGYGAAESAAGTLAATIASSDTTLTVSDGALVGVGSILHLDSERMLVTDKTLVDSTQTISAPLTAQASSVTVTIQTGSAFSVGEVLLIDSERMLVTDISGNNLTVKRAWEGTVLAAHSASAKVYAERGCTVTRGALGTAAAAHTQGASIAMHKVPALIRQLCIAEATTALLQEAAGYARTIGTENVRQALGVGLEDLRDRARRRYARLRTRTTARLI
jgi:hypothetical protein